MATKDAVGIFYVYILCERYFVKWIKATTKPNRLRLLALQLASMLTLELKQSYLCSC